MKSFNEIIAEGAVVAITKENAAVIEAARASAEKCCQQLSANKFVWRYRGELIGVKINPDSISIKRAIPAKALAPALARVAAERREELEMRNFDPQKEGVDDCSDIDGK